MGVIGSHLAFSLSVECGSNVSTTEAINVLYVLHCELKNNDRLYYTHNPPDTYNAIPHSGGTPTMQIYSHNVILYVYLLPQCTSCKLTPTPPHTQTNKMN